MRRFATCTAINLIVGLLCIGMGCSIGSAYGQDALLKHPALYVLPEGEAKSPNYVMTGRTACILAWEPRAFNSKDVAWRLRVLDAATLSQKVEVSLALEAGLTPSQSEESLDGKGCYILFESERMKRQVLLLYFRYADGGTESERYTLPLQVAVEQLLVSAQGAYIRGMSTDIPVLFYLDPDSRQGKVLPFGPDRANRLLGCGLEPTTGKLWLCLVRKGSNPGPMPILIRAYGLGVALGEHSIQGFPIDESPTAIHLSSDSINGTWIGFWGRRGGEIPQGPFSVKGFKVVEQVRFIDSLRFFDNESHRSAARHHRRWSRRKTYRLSYRYCGHGWIPRADGGFRLAAERYVIRQSTNASPFMNPYSMANFGTYYRYYETEAATWVDFDAQGRVKQLRTIPTPRQSHEEIKPRLILLPDRPPISLDKTGIKMALPQPTDARRITWETLPPASLGFGEGNTLSVTRLKEEGKLGFVFGEGQNERTRSGFFFLSRLPEPNISQ